jgi:hypothetical protein
MRERSIAVGSEFDASVNESHPFLVIPVSGNEGECEAERSTVEKKE